MAEFIVNPRRAPRAPARCSAAVVVSHARFETETEDIGSMGCQVVSPKLVRKGDAVELRIANERVAEPLEVTGRVAWVSAQAPWRVGIAFDEECLAESARFFDQLVSALPGFAGLGRIPERIRTDATVYLGAPPRFLLDFTTDEALLLRAIASGARIDELMARLRHGWPSAQRALFSLLARQAVTLQRGQAVHPDAWKRILTDIEASLAVESLGRDGVGAPVAPLAGAPEPSAATPSPVDGYPLAAAPLPPNGGEQPPDASMQPQGRRPGARFAPAPARDPTGAGIGWRRPAGRSADAQAAFERGLAELHAGNVTGAITFLRIALTLAPGDAEIAQQLGNVAFKGRPEGG